jgi:hypothetical protein
MARRGRIQDRLARVTPIRRVRQVLDACQVRSADQVDLAAHIRQKVAKSGTLTCAVAGITRAQGDLVGLGDVVCLDGPQSLP